MFFFLKCVDYADVTSLQGHLIASSLFHCVHIPSQADVILELADY